MKPIPDHAGYFADELGRIWTSRRRKAPRELVPFDRKTKSLAPSPYLSVNVKRDGDARPRNRYVHHLVALAFIGPRPEGAEVCHGPGGSKDNRPSNLRYDSPEANSAERELCRGDAWYLARGEPDPFSRSWDFVDVDGGCFADLLNGAP